MSAIQDAWLSFTRSVDTVTKAKSFAPVFSVKKESASHLFDYRVDLPAFVIFFVLTEISNTRTAFTSLLRSIMLLRNIKIP